MTPPQTDADLDRSAPQGAVLAAVAVGGVLGAEARYAVAQWLTHPVSSWPWSTLLINIVGSALLGALLAVLGGLHRPPALARPFLGVGVLGGFTTFSGFEFDVRSLLAAHRVAEAAGYAAVSVLACVAACAAAGATTAALLRTPGTGTG